MKILNSVKLMKLLVEVCRNAKNDADQDDINCEIPGRSKLLETKLTSVKLRTFPRKCEKLLSTIPVTAFINNIISKPPG
jgi:hypothetical protein